MTADPGNVFNFEQVPEGPPPRDVIPGFGGVAEIVRVVDDATPDLWVDVLVTSDGSRAVEPEPSLRVRRGGDRVGDDDRVVAPADGFAYDQHGIRRQVRQGYLLPPTGGSSSSPSSSPSPNPNPSRTSQRRRRGAG